MSFFLNWRAAVESRDTTAGLPSPHVDWKIEQLADHEKFCVFKHCYDMVHDRMSWVPMNQYFESLEEATGAVREYVSSRRPVYLDGKGEVVPS